MSSLERARSSERACANVCTRVYGVKPYTCTRARSCVRGIQCTEQCTERCIYTREIIAIGGALVSSRYIDLPASSSLSLLPKSEDFLRAEGRNGVRPSVRLPARHRNTSGRCVYACTFYLCTRIASGTHRFRGFLKRIAAFPSPGYQTLAPPPPSSRLLPAKRFL